MRAANILVVEDEPVNAVLIQHQLNKLGYSVAGIAASGEEAVAQVESLRPDLILMDINLNGGREGDMDGVEAAAVIHRKRAIPIIYLTAASDEKTIDRALATEAFGYLLKPLHERELHSAIQMALYKAWADTRVREEKQWLAATLRCVTDAVIAADADGAVKFANLAAEALTGWNERDALGRDLAEVYRLLEAGTRLPVECAVSQWVMDDQLAGTSSKLLVSREGKEIHIEQNAALITNEAGSITGVVYVFHPLPAGD
jgi:PAS domain S-box-containing protein